MLFPQDGRTPLYMASRQGRTDVVKALIEHKADPNITSEVSTLFTKPTTNKSFYMWIILDILQSDWSIANNLRNL